MKNRNIKQIEADIKDKSKRRRRKKNKTTDKMNIPMIQVIIRHIQIFRRDNAFADKPTAKDNNKD